MLASNKVVSSITSDCFWRYDGNVSWLGRVRDDSENELSVLIELFFLTNFSVSKFCLARMNFEVWRLLLNSPLTSGLLTQ